MERPGDLRVHHWHRLTLWMSFSGEITGTPRSDLLPYLQLDADVDKRVVTVSEGDMWQHRGSNRSGPAGQWKLADMTADLVTHTAVNILRRGCRAGQRRLAPIRRGADRGPSMKSPDLSDKGL